MNLIEAYQSLADSVQPLPAEGGSCGLVTEAVLGAAVEVWLLLPPTMQRSFLAELERPRARRSDLAARLLAVLETTGGLGRRA